MACSCVTLFVKFFDYFAILLLKGFSFEFKDSVMGCSNSRLFQLTFPSSEIVTAITILCDLPNIPKAKTKNFTLKFFENQIVAYYGGWTKFNPANVTQQF